ncbi:MAG: hydrogenase-4 subunit E [Leptospira sp.]|nr:hydrogenase-4 subunit E [Leptospira sp.]NCS94109.1 hydrogenase-4 subunit E [Leptospira sp.]
MESRRVVTGLFENLKFFHDGKSIFAEMSNADFRQNLNDSSIPISLLRYNYGLTWDEDYSRIDEERYLSTHRMDQLNYLYDSSKGIRGFDYSRLEVPLTNLDYSHAVGPIHAGLIEPGHFRFSVRGEEMRHLTIRLGFQRRNILDACKSKSVFEITNLLSSATMDSSVANSLAIIRAIESKFPSPISSSEELYRLILLETERLAVYVGDLGGIAGDVGFYPLLGVCSTERGFPLGWMELLTGSRFGRFVIMPFQSRFNGKASLEDIQAYLKRFHPWLKNLNKHIERAISSSTLRERMQNVGTVSAEQSWKYGFSGHTARSSLAKIDIRQSEPLYEKLDSQFFQSITSHKLTGDSWSRFLIRYYDIQKSVAIIQAASKEINWSELKRRWKPYQLENLNASHEQITYGVSEAWRGSLLVAFKWGANNRIDKIYYRDPSVLNWLSLELASRGMLIGDFPLLNKSFNHSYAGVDL